MLGRQLAAWLAANPRWRALIVVGVLLAGLIRVWTAKPGGVQLWPVVAAVVAAHAAGYVLDRWVGLIPRLLVGLAVFIVGWIKVLDMYPVLAAGFILLSPSPYVPVGGRPPESGGGLKGKQQPESSRIPD
ncbi:MAG: hypothetical protein BAA04_05130 [Firmicutes bacterium ZCTH02-B6]|nr:MAG: hypothetical protein BAA04_05130 [Firmicutes bacterium ZCTH02-B6]